MHLNGEIDKTNYMSVRGVTNTPCFFILFEIFSSLPVCEISAKNTLQRFTLRRKMAINYSPKLHSLFVIEETDCLIFRLAAVAKSSRTSK